LQPKGEPCTLHPSETGLRLFGNFSWSCRFFLKRGDLFPPSWKTCEMKNENLKLFDPVFCVFRLLLSGNFDGFWSQAEARPIARINKHANQFFTTLSNGCLGSGNDEERCEMRYVMRIAELSESSNFRTQIALLGYPWEHVSPSLGFNNSKINVFTW